MSVGECSLVLLMSLSEFYIFNFYASFISISLRWRSFGENWGAIGSMRALVRGDFYCLLSMFLGDFDILCYCRGEILGDGVRDPTPLTGCKWKCVS